MTASVQASNSEGGKIEKSKIFGNLIREVISPGFCIGCGACAASCRVNAIDIIDQQAKIVGSCETCNFCYYNCPQTGDPESIQRLVFGDESPEPDVGVYRKAFSVKTKDPEIQERCQDGGAVSSILVSLLDQDIIDAAVVMGIGDNPWKPEPKVATTEEEIIENGGTVYSPGPTLLGLRDAVDLYSKDKIAVVGTPCQVKALRRMQFDDMALYHLTDHVELVIGLFCMESYDYALLKKFVEDEFEIPLKDVSRFDIKKGKLIVHTEEGTKREMGVNSPNLKERINIPCTVCPDFSSELADISVGAVGSPDNHSTVLVRTEVGLNSFGAVEKNSDRLEAVPLDTVKPGIDLVKSLSNKKRKAAKEELKRRKGEEEPMVPWKEIGD